jgi:hypothetical protein
MKRRFALESWHRIIIIMSVYLKCSFALILCQDALTFLKECPLWTTGAAVPSESVKFASPLFAHATRLESFYVN